MRSDRLSRFAARAGLASALFGVIALLGWVFGLDELKSVVPGQVTMKPNTAVGLILAGCALTAVRHAAGRPGLGRLSKGAAAVLVALGLATIVEYALGRDLGIDQVLWHEPRGVVGTVIPGRMAANTAVAFVLVGLALLLLDRRVLGRFWPATWLSVATAAMSLLALIGYTTGVTSFYGIEGATQMAVPTGTALVLLSTGLLCVRPDRSPLALFVARTPGGAVVRRLIPAAVGLPLVLGTLRLVGQHQGLFGTNVGTWLFVVTVICLLVPAVWSLARSLDRFEEQRQRADAALREAQEAHALFDDAAIGSAVVGLDGRYVRVNQALCELTGYREDELTGAPITTITHPEDHARDADAFRQLIDGERQVFQTEKRYLHRDGSELFVLLSAHPIRGEGGVEHVFSQMVDITARRQAETQLGDAQLEILERLALAAEYRDDDTGEHTRRVGESAAAIAETLGLPRDEVELIRRAAPLHDVGKIAVPDAILLKPGRLTVEEFEQIKEHTVKGAAMLSGRAFPLLDLAERIALTHHERWDGQGYPHGLAGDAIPLAGRIVAVADVFDALTHDRVYKQAWPVEEALDEVRTQAGRQFDPGVVEAFLHARRERHPSLASAEEAPAPQTRSPALTDSLTINTWRPQPSR